MADARCHRCDRVLATDADWDACDDCTGCPRCDALCWSRWHGDCPAVDWRARYLALLDAARAARAEWLAYEADAGHEDQPPLETHWPKLAALYAMIGGAMVEIDVCPPGCGCGFCDMDRASAKNAELAKLRAVADAARAMLAAHDAYVGASELDPGRPAYEVSVRADAAVIVLSGALRALDGGSDG